MSFKIGEYAATGEAKIRQAIANVLKSSPGKLQNLWVYKMLPQLFQPNIDDSQEVHLEAVRTLHFSVHLFTSASENNGLCLPPSSRKSLSLDDLSWNHAEKILGNVATSFSSIKQESIRKGCRWRSSSQHTIQHTCPMKTVNCSYVNDIDAIELNGCMFVH